jgi:hypothetical protein
MQKRTEMIGIMRWQKAAAVTTMAATLPFIAAACTDGQPADDDGVVPEDNSPLPGENEVVPDDEGEG